MSEQVEDENLIADIAERPAPARVVTEEGKRDTPDQSEQRRLQYLERVREIRGAFIEESECLQRLQALRDAFGDNTPDAILGDYVSDTYATDDYPSETADEFLNVPGLIGEAAAWCTRTAPRQQPTLSLCAGIATQGILSARRVIDKFDNGTGLYLIGLCTTGGGKNNPKRLPGRILGAANLTEQLLAGSGWASAAGFRNSVERQPWGGYVVDEIGQYLSIYKSGNAQSYQTEIPTLMLQLFSEQYEIVRPHVYAKEDDNVTICQPVVTVLGFSTEETFTAALSEKDIASGLIPRLIIMQGDDGKLNRDPPREPIPESIITTAKAWAGFRDVPHGIAADPFFVPWESAATEVFRAFVDEAERNRKRGGVRRDVWSRAHEKACRLALIYACSEHGPNPEFLAIAEGAAQWACGLSRHVTEQLIGLCESRINDGPFGQLIEKSLEFVRKCGGCSQTSYTKRFKNYKPVDRKAAVDTLIQMGAIQIRKEGQGRSERLILIPTELAL